MKNVILGLLAITLLSSCSKEPAPQTYHNPEIGLTITYPGTWRVMKRVEFNDAMGQMGRNVPELPPDIIDETKEMVPHIILSLIKPHRVGGANRNPSINVFVMDVPKDECDDVDMDAIMQEQIGEVESSRLPGARVTINDFPLPNYPSIHNYSVRIPLPGRTTTVYQYAYWHPPYFVQIAVTFSDPDLEQELKEIIASMRINTSARPPAGDMPRDVETGD